MVLEASLLTTMAAVLVMLGITYSTGKLLDFLTARVKAARNQTDPSVVEAAEVADVEVMAA